MLAARFDLADPDFPVSLVDLDEPALPGPAWARVAVTAGGICGSDLHLFGHGTGPSPTLASTPNPQVVTSKPTSTSSERGCAYPTWVPCVRYMA